MITAIVGGNWGDEGKGKLTDVFAADADYVIRFQGGANAGHTIINQYGKNVLHILPSGVFQEGTVNIIGPGAAFNVERFRAELEDVKKSGAPAPNILVSDRAQLVMPYHILFDKLEEQRLGKNSFGSTQSGIAPHYADKAMKIGFQLAELYNENLAEKVERVCIIKNATIKGLYPDAALLDPKEILAYLKEVAAFIKPYLCNMADLMHEAVKADKNIVLEGQLGALRDITNGIYPMTTSSSTLAGYGAVGACLPPHAIKRVITAAVLIIVMGLGIWLQGWPLRIILLIAMLGSTFEMYRAFRRIGYDPVRWTGYVYCVMAVLAQAFYAELTHDHLAMGLFDSISPPTFALFVNSEELMHFSYQRYLENCLRKAFGFEGTPIRFLLREKKKEDTRS